MPDDVTAGDLDPDVRRDLLTLDKANAEQVARHLVMVTRLLEDDPAAALAHARAARGRASRVGLVRETVGIAAYSAGEWQEAVSELRAARRITGGAALLPLIADAERGLGRPDRAIEIARSDDARTLDGDEATEMRIVEAGARLDLGEFDKAIVTLQSEDLRPGRTGTQAARLFYAYASALEAAGRGEDAATWYMNAASADIEDATDAEVRLAELAGEFDGDEAVADEAVAEESTVDGDAVTPVEPAQIISNGSPTQSAAPRGGAEPAAARSDAASRRPEESPAARTHAASVAAPAPAPAGSVAAAYDALLLDLDGTVFAGREPIPGAAESLAELDVPQLFVTNNASRRPDAVVAHLTELGFTATEAQVVTSAQTAARLLSEHLEPGSRALVLGSDGLAQEVREVGIGVTRNADDRPAAVIQGYSPDTGWVQLSEAALAIRAGALWIATNTDATLPSERGLMIGNGSLVAAVANATGAAPLVAGKPAAPLMSDAIARSGGDNPLVVGDRLDTDIQGAHAVSLDSVLVLTGVSTALDVLLAPPEQRPTFVTADLAGLFSQATAVRIDDGAEWTITANGNKLTVAAGDDAAQESLLPRLAYHVWRLIDDLAIDPSLTTIVGADPSTAELLDALGVGQLH